MRFLTAIRLGLRRLHRHFTVVVLAYLAALVPALLIASLVHANLADSLDPSLFASRVFSIHRSAVWADFLASPDNALGTVFSGLGSRLLLVLLLQIAISAGIVEVLLGTAPRGGRPFLLGVGRHFWRFLRGAIWFLVCLLLVGGGLFAVTFLIGKVAADRGDGTLSLYANLTVLVVALFAFGPLKTAYDLSRVAAAAHGEGNTFVGFFRALGHCIARPAILLPLYLTFALLALAIHAGYFAARDVWAPTDAGFVVLLFAAQQTVLFLRAYLRGALWSAEIAYYQAIGEPRWCRRR
jgi:hypothetical protein